METKLYEILGIKAYRRFVLWCKRVYNKLTKTEHNQNYLLSGYTKEDIRFLREQFVKNLKIHLLGTLIGLLVLISVFSNDEISMVRLFLGAFVFFINLYSALLQRYNLIRIDRILAGRMKRAEKRQRVQG